MNLIVGLGNDFLQYKNTRHNIGFIILDELAKEYDFTFNIKKDCKSWVSEQVINGIKYIFAKPNQYMNNSGLSLISLCSKYKPTAIIILHDELDLQIGELKSKLGGGANGHNGLKSVSSSIGKNYYKIKIGIGRPKKNIETNADIDISSYVLSDFEKQEISLIKSKKIEIFNMIENIAKTSS